MRSRLGEVARAPGLIKTHPEDDVPEAAVTDRLSALILKDVTVVREVARNAGADLRIIGTVLSSDAVTEKVLRAVDAPDNQDTRRAAS